MLEPASPRYTRQECKNCRANTCGPVCGCCGSNHVSLPDAPKIVPLAKSVPVTQPAAVPFTRWAP